MAKKVALDFTLINYDIETSHLKGRFWRLGDQTVRHGQLLKNAKYTQILTISYSWYHTGKIVTLDCGDDGSNTKKMIEQFDAEIRKADVVIGKNNQRFDDQHINTLRLLTDGAPMPEWAYKSDDVEKQLRRYFKFPSFSLDYVSELLGHGGKMKMEESDWNDIEDMIEFNKIRKFISKGKTNFDGFCHYYYGKTALQVLADGAKAFNKMKLYNRVDIKRTEAVLVDILPHVQLKYNAATKKKKENPFACITCGSIDTFGGQFVSRGTTRREEFTCNAHKGYAGSRPFVVDNNFRKRYTGPMGK